MDYSEAVRRGSVSQGNSGSVFLSAFAGLFFLSRSGLLFISGKGETDCADSEGLLRIVQSIPSPKAEPFKRWLAKVGSERLEEIQDPELAAQRMRAIYKAKGYSDVWIEKRLRGVAVRDELTNEWKKRDVKEATEYAILTAEISKATFGMTPAEYKSF